jgi:AAA domain
VSGGWQAVNLAAPEFERPTEPPSVCGLLYRGKRHAISGPPEAAKTLAALILGLEHVRADLGAFALIDFEMGEHATRLVLQDLGATIDEVAAVYYVSPDGPPASEDIEAIAAAGVTLAIIDSAAGAYNVSGLDDYKRADAEQFSRSWVAPLWERDVTTVVLDHVVKNSETRGRFAIGSERKLGAVDVHLGFEPVRPFSRGGQGLIRVTTHKDRPGHLTRPHPAELELVSHPDTHAIAWTFKPASGDAVDGASWRPTGLMERVLAHVAEPWYEPLSRSALAEAVKGRRQYVLLAIDYLLDEQRLHLDNKKVVPVPGTFPGTSSETEGNGNVPRSLTTQRERFSGTTSAAA